MNMSRSQERRDTGEDTEKGCATVKQRMQERVRGQGESLSRERMHRPGTVGAPAVMNWSTRTPRGAFAFLAARSMSPIDRLMLYLSTTESLLHALRETGASLMLRLSGYFFADGCRQGVLSETHCRFATGDAGASKSLPCSSTEASRCSSCETSVMSSSASVATTGLRAGVSMLVMTPRALVVVECY